ncbi:hypothetical protein Cni_G15621 [Canna indica]|uniref:Glycosyltransferases n=1 Tax=Canna indica TaxID=4628 RepID=A0AAQ3KI72_9LILI|nr:hypothetical protein Cni_G15621 [Canna indica]
MGSMDRSKKRIQLWKKALIHFALCFVMGFFTGFAPTSPVSLFSTSSGGWITVKPAAYAAADKIADPGVANRSLMVELPPAAANPNPASTGEKKEEDKAGSKRQLIVVTTTRSGDRMQEALLRRLADTLKLVPSPLLWIVVQARADVAATAAMLRKTGVVYRHLAFKENFTDAAAEADHQRNVALNHIEHHRLSGIVHFAGVSNIYDLQFFREIRQIEVFGTWKVAMVSANRKRVVVDGPVCNASSVVGWHSKDFSSDKVGSSNVISTAEMKVKPPPKINVSGFAFNSSILWDPERWGRATSVPDTSQDSVKFVQEVILEDETKLKGLPADCSKIMMWHLHIPRSMYLPFH